MTPRRPPFDLRSLTRLGAPVALCVALLSQACGGAPAPSRPPSQGKARAPSAPRYFVTSAYDAQTSGAERAAPSEVVLVEGRRVVVRGGEVLRVLRDAERLDGLRHLPKRLGGGLVLWNAGRAFRAATPEGPLEPLDAFAPRGGVRPWLDGLVLRTPQGLMVSKKGSAPTPLAVAGAGLLVDAVAASGERAAVLDAFGRAHVTLDGGATWRDASRELRAATDGLSLDADGTLVLRGRPTLFLEAQGAAGPVATDDRPSAGRRGVKPRAGRARALEGAMEDSLPFALELAEHAVSRGVPLAGAEPTGDRVVVVHEGRLVMLSASTLSWLQGAPLHELEEMACEAARVGGELVAACSSVNGSLALSLEDRIGRSRTEATFRKPSRGFVAGDDALLHLGPCGSEEPTLDDLEVGASSPHEYQGYYPYEPPEPPEQALPRDLPPDTHSLVCLRRPGGRWEPHGLYGRDAKQLYRFVVGGDGRMVALVLDDLELGPDEAEARVSAGGRALVAQPEKPRGPKKSDPLPPADPAVRVVRLKATDPALQGARLAGLRVSPQDGSSLQIDREFWLEGDVVRGWASLPEGFGQEGFEPPPASPSSSLSDLVSSELGSPAAGVRIHPSGKIELLLPPKGTTRVIHGGRFALAMSEGELGAPLFHESTDGGATWREIEGPPFGGIDPFIDAYSPVGCSANGCVLSRGLMRVGWGEGKRREPLPELVSPKAAPEPRPLELTCTLERALAGAASSPKVPKPALKPAPKPAKPAKPTPRPPAAVAPLGAGIEGPGGKKGKVPAKPPPSPVALDEPAALLAVGAGGPKARGVADATGWSVRWVRPFSAEPPSLVRAPLVPTTRESLAAPVLGPKGASLLATLGERSVHAPTKGQAEVYSHGGARVARALELTGGELVTLDLDRRVVGFGKLGVAPSLKGAREGALGELFSPARLDEPFGLKLSLGLGDGGAPLLVAYAPTSGQLTVAPIDVGGAQVRGASRSLPSLAGLDVDPRCAPGASALRTVLELPVALELTEPGAPSKVSATYGALVLVRVGDARVCVEGLELDTPGAQGLHLALANTPDKVRARAYRGLVDAAATCTLSPRAPSAPRR